jgi:cytochrome c peroxidase
MDLRRGKIWLACLALGWLAWTQSSVASAQRQGTARSPLVRAQIALGQRLFRDERFSTPKGDLPASCQSCHLFNEDPQGLRAFTDFFNRSWFSYRSADPRRLHARNSPVLYDVALHPALHSDGEFPSLEALAKGTFAGRPMGWLPGEEAEAFETMRAVLLRDRHYPAQFNAAFKVNLATLNAEQAAQQAALAVAAFLRTLRSPLDSPYDRFLKANRLNDQAREPLLARLTQPEALQLTPGFDAAALHGMQIFFRTNGTSSVGNCVACHTPPLFTDFSFHNVGISQDEYDTLHGAGRFAALAIPATAQRPIERLRMAPERGLPERADLGHWNIIDLARSPLRRAGESDEALLQRMLGAFKTPTLRHLVYSYPYFHNGAATDLADALRVKIRLSEQARAGGLRAADDELWRMRLSAADVTPLVRFLATLNEPLRAPY